MFGRSGRNESASSPGHLEPHQPNESFDAEIARARSGQLYFDSSHFPCKGGVGKGAGNPKRKSLWEIHPIYKFEVCTADCDGEGN